MVKKLIFGVVLWILLFSNLIYAGEWVKDGGEWEYKDGETYYTSIWKLINVNNDYNNYYFNDKSHMVTGLYKIDDNIYAFTKDGICLSNKKIRIDNIEYNTGNKGIVNDVDISFLELNYGGEWQENNNKYQFICDGVPVKNEWRIISSDDNNSFSYYYFDDLGNMVSGLQQINGKYYLFDKDGKARGHESIYLYNEITTDTDDRGELTYIPDDFSIEKYNQKLEESLHFEENEKLALQKMNEEASKNSTPKTNITPIGEELIEKSELKEATGDSTYRMSLGEKGSAEIISEYDAKITINFQYPIVTGEKAEMINNTIKSNLSKIIRNYFEDVYSNASKRSVVNLNGVEFSQIKDSHLLKFIFRGGSRQIVVYLNTITMEMYSDN